MEKYYSTTSYYNKSSSSSRTLEITVLSGEDLRINRRSVKKNTFVVIRSDVAADCPTTATDTEGGSYPKWNEKLVVNVPAHALAVTLEVRCKTAFGDKIVGTASVPVSDFSGGFMPDGCLHFLSYRLRDSRGERNGVINISVRTRVPALAVAAGAAKEYGCSASALAAERTTVGVPVAGGVVATGVPVWLSHNTNGKYF